MIILSSYREDCNKKKALLTQQGFPNKVMDYFLPAMAITMPTAAITAPIT